MYIIILAHVRIPTNRSKKTSDISMFLIVIYSFKKFRQGHRVQFSQWYHSMVKDKIYKCLPTHFFCASSYSFRNIIILNYWRLERWSRLLRTIFENIFSKFVNNGELFNINLEYSASRRMEATHTYARVHIHTCTHIHTHRYTHTHKHTQTHTYTQIS